MAILDYKAEILSKLIEKYNKRDLKYSGKEINREISIKPKEVYSLYATASAETQKEKLLNEAAETLEQNGFVSIRRVKFSDDIIKIILNQEALEDINKYLVDNYHISSRNDTVSNVLALIQKYRGYGILTDYYCNKLENFVGSKISDVNLKREENNFKVLDFIQKNSRDYYVREVSMLVFGSSKELEEPSFYENICTIIREAIGKEKDDYTLNDEILRDFHIHNIDQEILIKGNVTISFSGHKIFIGDFINGLAIPSSEIFRIDHIDVVTNKVLTIENKTPFYRFSDKEYAVVYLGGFANRYQVEFLKKIHQYDPSVSFYHFGDIDMGGLFIHQHLCNSTGLHFELFHMGCKDLMAEENKTCLQPLTEFDRERARSLISVSEYRDVVEMMMKNNVKLEQEIVCLNLC